MQNRKLDFWSVFALVTGAQIGSGVFMLPANLAPFGAYALLGWLIAGIGAITLALVFAQLCAWYPKTGGPHVYVNEAFGVTSAFFTGWTYWIISWVSTTVVVIASVGYLTPVVGSNPIVLIFLELLLIVAITVLNFRGVGVAGRVEFILSLLKIIPLMLVPALVIFYFNGDNFYLEPDVANLGLTQLLSRVTLITLWGFIGLESATTPAESVEHPSKTIPRAVILGTICVGVLYVLNSVAIMGAIPGQELMNSNAPYADAVRFVFGGNWHIIISVIAAIICIGTMNAWTLTSGQISLGLAQDNLLPVFFSRKNRFGAPIWGLSISCIGIMVLLILTANKNLASQILYIIDISVTAFLYVYLMCSLAFFKLLWQKRKTVSGLPWHGIYGAIAFIFCCWIISQTPLSNLFVAGLFVVSGLPWYLSSLAKR